MTRFSFLSIFFFLFFFFLGHFVLSMLFTNTWPVFLSLVWAHAEYLLFWWRVRKLREVAWSVGSALCSIGNKRGSVEQLKENYFLFVTLPTLRRRDSSRRLHVVLIICIGGLSLQHSRIFLLPNLILHFDSADNVLSTVICLLLILQTRTSAQNICKSNKK